MSARFLLYTETTTQTPHKTIFINKANDPLQKQKNTYTFARVNEDILL